MFSIWFSLLMTGKTFENWVFTLGTLPTAEILSGKNARAWVSIDIPRCIDIWHTAQFQLNRAQLEL